MPPNPPRPAGYIETAYTLLPPPLAALPAKYWTSISLWLHSYTVARTFQELVKAYTVVKEVDSPLDDEAFIIGFLHDLGQKLRLKGKPSEKRIIEWVRGKLEDIGYTSGEAEEYSRYLYTNPAENMLDPLYDKSIWRLLWLADRLQGTANPIAIVRLLEEAKEDLGFGLNITLLNITTPHPFLRTLVSKTLREKIEELTEHDGKLAIPVSTPYGLAVISNEPSLTIDIEWDEIRRGFDGDGILDGKTEEDLEWNIICCKDPDCKKRCSKKKKPDDCKQHGFTKRDCEKRYYPVKGTSSYEIALIYYGYRKKLKGTVILPEEFKNSLQGINIRGIQYRKGDRVCPICGLSTPVGVTGDFLQFFNKGITTEQWTRRLYPKSVNYLMQNVKPYGVDPLCLGEVILRGRVNYNFLITLTVSVHMPLHVLEEIGKLMWTLLFTLGQGIPRANTVEKLVYNENDFNKVLKNIVDMADVSKTPNYFYDVFTSTVIVPYRNAMQKHQDEWIRDITTAGILTTWGFYPLTISEAVPLAPSNVLLSYYKGMKPLYSYQPSDKRLGRYTPYVTTAMASLSRLSERKRNENIPALLEILDYPPEFSPLLLQYGSSLIYSRLEALRVRLGVVV